ncbi:OmpA family protein [Pacificoceanicola onchidii]|uniref:OmpA family protein n=1 Tax=Pacificoceanicola onchidii TaxID=2562685 RepID=UPI001F108666|nr:OmpA family protein [Pacificoceanicola onchidii]
MMNTTRQRAKAAGIVWLLCAGAGMAQDLSLPSGAVVTREFTRDAGAYDLPIGPWAGEGGVPVRRIEGTVSAQSWRIESSSLTPFQIVAPIREKLAEVGYEIVLDCVAQGCGGFDFRFSTFVLPEPQMFVDLTDFMAVSAVNPEGSAVSLLASRDATSAYVQIVRVGQAAALASTKTDLAPVRSMPAAGDVVSQLESTGFAILRDMVFETGSSSLGEGNVPSLDDIATYLRANPSRQILFVGHTDAVGSLSGNQALSKKRAESAVRYLRDRFDIPAAQIGSDGVGFLAPVASNLTAEGRDANRRVEAVLISTQ